VVSAVVVVAIVVIDRDKEFLKILFAQNHIPANYFFRNFFGSGITLERLLSARDVR
jgi:hypothetical protein